MREFFERQASSLHGQPEWKEWFALPYLPSPQELPAFSVYFTRQWQDTLWLSLHNFLTLVFSALPPPRLADYQRVAGRTRAMREEIKQLKLRLAGEPQLLRSAAGPPPDIMDDFSLIAQEHEVVDTQVCSVDLGQVNFSVLPKLR